MFCITSHNYDEMSINIFFKDDNHKLLVVDAKSNGINYDERRSVYATEYALLIIFEKDNVIYSRSVNQKNIWYLTNWCMVMWQILRINSWIIKDFTFPSFTIDFYSHNVIKHILHLSCPILILHHEYSLKAECLYSMLKLFKLKQKLLNILIYVFSRSKVEHRLDNTRKKLC